MYGWTSMNDSVTRSRVSYGLGFKLCQGMSQTKSDSFLIDDRTARCRGQFRHSIYNVDRLK